MNLTTRTTLTLSLLLLSTAALGQDSETRSTPWTIGGGVAVIDSPYAGEGTRIRPLPFLGYEGERIFLRGIAGGVHLHRSRAFTLDAIVSARLDGFDIDDLGRAELTANGLSPDLLSDRDDGLDAGVRATFGSEWGSISLQGVRDISNASDGYELSADYRATWSSDAITVTTNVGASWMSSDLAGYYFGILDEEVSRGVTPYSPGSVVVPRVGVTVMQPLGATWQLLGSLEYRLLPSALDDSPLLEPDTDGFGRVVIGLSRRF